MTNSLDIDDFSSQLDDICRGTPDTSFTPEDNEEEKDGSEAATDETPDGLSISTINNGKDLKPVTGRGVTLALLLKDKIIEPGKDVLSIEYLGKKFTADLLPDGKLCSQMSMFNSPSAWAIHCKKVVNPDKKSGCGWGSVRYNGKKLDTYKTQWLRNKGLVVPPGNSKLTVEEFSFNAFKQTENKPPTAENANNPIPHGQLPLRTQSPNPYTLIEYIPSSSQPFFVTVNISALIVMDAHAHSSSSQISGYLAGTWDPTEQELKIIAAFPLFCAANDTENASKSEEYVRFFMQKRDLILAGWYHSHPKTSPCPSIFDIDCHMEYTYKLRGTTYQPIVAAIFSPFKLNENRLNSDFELFWVSPPPENRSLEFPKPVLVDYSINHDSLADANVLLQFRLITAFYKEMIDGVQWGNEWRDNITYWEKLKASISHIVQRFKFDDQLLADFYETIDKFIQVE